MEQIIKVMIYVHAFFGGMGLITGAWSLAVRKGGGSHRKTGKIFSFSMIISALISLVIARMPHHENLFLFLIGIFTIYMVLAGNRALTLKSRMKAKADWIDKSVSGAMVLASITMLIIGITGMMQKVDGSVLYIFFSSFGLFMSLKDFQTFRTFTQKKNAWLVSHIGRMVGAMIASVTAFLVAGLNIGTIAVWMAPTILGTGYIIYWVRKVSGGKAKAVTANL